MGFLVLMPIQILGNKNIQISDIFADIIHTQYGLNVVLKYL